MSSGTRLAALLAALGLLGGPISGAAATFLVIESGAIGERERERTEIWAEAERMRVDLAAGRHSIVYSVEHGIVWALDHERRSVLELDRSTATGVATRLRGVEAELRTRTAALPPKAREAARGLLDSTFGPEALARPALELRATPVEDAVRGIPCRVSELYVDGALPATFCEARLVDADVPADALAPVRSLSAFARDVSPLLPNRLVSAGLAALDLFDRVDGVPLRVRSFEGGRAAREAIVTEVSQADPPDGAFDVPEGYRSEIAIKVRERIGGP